MFSAGELVATFSLDGKSVESAMAGVTRAFSGLGQTLSGLGLTAAVTRPLLSAARQVAGEGMAFAAEMSRVGAVMNLEGLGVSAEEAGERMEALRETALRMGETTSLSAYQAAQAMENLAMAGWKDADIQAAIEPLIRLSEVAGDGDLAGAAGIVADSLTALHLDAGQAGRLADVLTGTATGSNTDLMKLGTTFRYVANLAGSLGYSMEDLALASGLLANSGVKAQKAGTGLRAMLNQMSSGKKAQAAMESLGIRMYDAEGHARSLRDVMEDLRHAFAGLSEEDKAKNAYALAGTSGMNAVLAIAGASEAAYRQLAEAIDGSAGAAGRASAKMLDNLQGDLTLLTSALGTAKIRLADAATGPARRGVQALTAMVAGWNALGGGESGALVRLAALAAAAGPAVTALGLLEGAAASLAPALLGLMSPAGLLTAGLAALAASAMESGGGMAQLISRLGGAAEKASASALEGLERGLQRAQAALPGLVTAAGDAISRGLPAVLSVLTKGASLVMDTLARNLGGTSKLPAAILRAVSGSLREGLPGLVRSGVRLASALAEGVIRGLPEIVRCAGEAAEGLLEGLRQLDVRAEAERLMRALGSALTSSGEGLLRLASGLGASAASWLLEGLGAGSGGAAGLWEGLFSGDGAQGALRLAAAMGEKVMGTLTRALEGAAGRLPDLSALLGRALGRLDVQGVTAALGAAAQRLGEGAAKLLSAAAALAGKALSEGLEALGSLPFPALLSGAARGLEAAARGLWANLAAAFEAAADLGKLLERALARVDFAALGRGAADLALRLLGMLGEAVAQLDAGEVARSLTGLVSSVLDAATRAAGGFLGRLAEAVTNPEGLRAFFRVGVQAVSSLMEGILSGISGLAQAVLQGAANLLGPALSGLFGGTFESRTQDIALFEGMRFSVSPALFGSAEVTGREVERLAAQLLNPGGLRETRDLERAGEIYDRVLASRVAGAEQLERAMRGLSRTGVRDAYAQVLGALSTGEGMERAGQDAALLYMTGFSGQIAGTLEAAGEAGRDLALAMDAAMQGFAEGGTVDVGAYAASLSRDLSDILGAALPEGYRLAFDGAQTALVRVTEEGLRTAASAVSYESLVDGQAIWEEVERTSLAQLGALSGEMAGLLRDMGVEAMAVLGHTLTDSAAQAVRASLEAGDLQGAAGQLLAAFSLQGAGESLGKELEAGLSAGVEGVKAASEELMEAAAPGDALSELFSAAGTEAAGSAALALQEASPQVQSAADQAGREAAAAFAASMTAAEGERVARSYAQGVARGLSGGEVRLAAQRMGSAALGALSASLSPDMARSLGARFAAGLSAGLRGGIAGAAAAAALLASRVAAQVRSSLQIHSPSRVAEALGGQFAAGLALGLGQVHAAESAARALSASVIRGTGLLERSAREAEVRVPLPRTAETEARALEAAGRREDMLQTVCAALSGLTLVLDGHEVGKAVAPGVSEIIAREAAQGRYRA